MIVSDPDEVMQSLIGRSIADWGRDVSGEHSMYHITLDDGRMLIFLALGIVVYQGEHAVH